MLHRILAWVCMAGMCCCSQNLRREAGPGTSLYGTPRTFSAGKSSSLARQGSRDVRGIFLKTVLVRGPHLQRSHCCRICMCASVALGHAGVELL